ncbi:MAG TPA: peptidoglycan DD-metalloendopeptidase family protein [Actinomycetota bacterium]|nr:peptidoglycan DD-metalloendopeptidase family protein [Actinomycetota bacterium]
MRATKWWVAILTVFVGAITGVAAFGANIGFSGGGGGRVSSQSNEISPDVVAAVEQARWEAVQRMEAARIEAERLAEKQRREAEKQRREAAIRAKVSRYGLSWPHVDMITSHFGNRRRGFHNGMDILCSKTGGEPIFAAAPGRVIASNNMPVYGRAVILQHQNGTKTLYAHMWSLRVRAGEWVERGQVVGTCGSTGNSTNPHLHFEFYRNGRTVNPLHHLPAWT